MVWRERFADAAIGVVSGPFPQQINQMRPNGPTSEKPKSQMRRQRGHFRDKARLRTLGAAARLD
eukprot:4832122-Prymnesium_polylepis.1